MIEESQVSRPVPFQSLLTVQDAENTKVVLDNQGISQWQLEKERQFMCLRNDAPDYNDNDDVYDDYAD